MRRVTAALAVLVLAPAVAAQSTLDRGPNLTGTWTVPTGVFQFNFIHRFRVGPAPTHKVTNTPTFVFGIGPVAWLSLIGRYASNSTTATLAVDTGFKPNEFEALAKSRVLGGPGRGPIAVGLTAGYNTTTESVDGELAGDLTTRRFTFSAAGRGMSAPYGLNEARFALAGGLAFRLNDYVALAGDVAALTERVSPTVPNRAAWGAGLQFGVPGSGHSVSLQATNSSVNTLEGASVGGSDVLYGFEFTIPIHFKRFAPLFKGSSAQPTAEAGGPVAATIEIRELNFPGDTITVRVGQAIRWVNQDPVEHTITFDDGSASSPLLAARQAYRRVFEGPGVFTYHCTPHPFMRGVVKVVP